MPKARRDTVQFLPHGYYHIYNRGARRLTLFHENDNYIFVLNRIKKYLQRFDLAMIAYCLMPNHYHLLIRQNSEHAAGLLPQRVFNSYSKAYNKRYNHSGTLFEGRFKAKAVDSDAYLLHLCRYIHANPVKHKFCNELEEWPYSNYQEWIGSRQGTLIDRAFVDSRFPVADEYEAFVLEFLRMSELPEELSYLKGFDT